ncbi:MAG: GNAT family N-acetyltransferase [Pseudomonadota bacterium]
MTPETLARLHALSFGDAPRPWSAKAFEDLLSAPGVFMMTEDEAFLIWRDTGDGAEILTLATPPRVRRQGKGRQLVLGFLDAAQHVGAPSAFLEVAETNAPAQALYAKCGFAPVGRRKNYYRTHDGRRVDALVLKKQLAI